MAYGEQVLRDRQRGEQGALISVLQEAVADEQRELEASVGPETGQKTGLGLLLLSMLDDVLERAQANLREPEDR